MTAKRPCGHRRFPTVVLPMLAVLLGLAGAALWQLAMAAPLAQDVKPVIAQPTPGATVNGVVAIIGTATHPDFQRYELYYAPWPVPGDSSWIFIGPDAHFQQQSLGLLGNWDSRAVPDGNYALRVRVVKKDGNYVDSDPSQVVVANNGPASTPTPTATTTASPTPTGPAATLPPPTVALIATVPVNVAPTVVVTATGSAGPGGAATPALPAADSLSLASTAGQILDPGRLIDSARTAATYTVALFVAVGLFFAIKGLLYWLWLKIKP